MNTTLIGKKGNNTQMSISICLYMSLQLMRNCYKYMHKSVEIVDMLQTCFRPGQLPRDRPILLMRG